MAEEPDNLLLKMLREIRSKQDEHSERLDAHGQILDRLVSEVQEIRHSVIYPLGLGTTQG